MPFTTADKIRKLHSDDQVLDEGPSWAAIWVNASGQVMVNIDGTPTEIGAGGGGGGSGDVTAASNFGTDNRVIRSNGTSKGVQGSGVTIDDSANVTGVTSIDAPILGTTGATTRIRSSLGTPGSLSNGDAWVEGSGTTPARTLALKVRDNGVTYTIASITV